MIQSEFEELERSSLQARGKHLLWEVLCCSNFNDAPTSKA
jgi:hypothetical protein